jgi:hypothetical protein
MSKKLERRIEYHHRFNDKIGQYHDYKNNYWFFKFYDKDANEIYCETSDGFTLIYHKEPDGRVWTELKRLQDYLDCSYPWLNWQFITRYEMALHRIKNIY